MENMEPTEEESWEDLEKEAFTSAELDEIAEYLRETGQASAWTSEWPKEGENREFCIENFWKLNVVKGKQRLLKLLTTFLNLV